MLKVIDYVELNSTPCDEECVQVSQDKNYLPEMRKECERYRELLQDIFVGYEQYGHFVIKSNPHDFGSYLEVKFAYDPTDPVAESYAWKVQDRLPSKWTDREPIVIIPDKEEEE